MLEFVNVKVALPSLTPVTVPKFETEAMDGLELVHVPPVVGETDDDEFIHIGFAPVTLTIGLAFTIIGVEARDEHPVELCVKVKVAIPPAIPVTIPALVTVATVGLLLDHVPPVLGNNEVVLPMQIFVEPATFIAGRAFTPIVVKPVPVHPRLFVTVTRYIVDGGKGLTVTDCDVALPALVPQI